MADRSGQQLGNYRLVRLLGEGSFAEVYLGEHIHLDTRAAIKVLHTQLADHEADKFRTEARTIAHLVHPHIVRVLDFGIEGKTPFLVMDFAPKGTLRQRHSHGTPVPLSNIILYVKQIAAALQYAHDKNLIHRDIKPENMLVGTNNDILLSDFGIALRGQSSRYESNQEVAGTTAYMAPEQLQGRPRPASDQYALGVGVYEWLCGERPFDGSFPEVVAKHLTMPPPRLRERVPTIPPDVEEVVMIALSKDYKQRFGSVRAFARALEQASQIAPSTLPMEMVKLMPPSAASTRIVISTSSTVLPLPPSESASPDEPQQAKPAISRRAVVLALAGLTAASAGIVWLVFRPAPHPPRKTSTSTPAPPSPGTTLFTYRGHSGTVYAVDWSPDGRRIASGSTDKTVQVWDASTGATILTYRGHSDTVNAAVAWSPNGKYLASGSADKTVQVWDASTGATILTYRDHSDAVEAVVWSPDGRYLASGSTDTTVRVWDASTGATTLVYRGHSTIVYAVDWSPDGRRIASGSTGKTVQVWDASTGVTILIYRGHSDAVDAVAWSPDGRRIASGSDDTTAQVWDASSGATVLVYRHHSDAVEEVAWSPDGKRIASGSNDKTVQVWDAATGATVLIYRHHSGTVEEVAWSPDGKRIASGSDDKTVQVWQAS